MVQTGDKKFILFGSGQIGQDALGFLGAEHVGFFVNNKVTEGEKETVAQIDVISFAEYRNVYKDYLTLVTTNEENRCQIENQLLSEGIDKFLFWEDVIGWFNNDQKQFTKENVWKKNILQTIKESVPFLKQDKYSEVEFYLVDSFEISHFLPIYTALKRVGVKTQFVVEPVAINSAGRWFDYQEAVDILEKGNIEYCTLKNPNAQIAFTTQFAENLKYYRGLRCQMSYGVSVMRQKAFQLKKEVAIRFDYIFTHGTLYRDIISHWVSPSHVIDMSYPKYLKEFDKKTEKEDILNKLKIDTNKPIVLYYPTWDEYASILQYKNAINALRKRFFLISKPHHCIWRFQEKVEALHECSDLVLDAKYNLYWTAQIADCAICDAKSGVVTELAFLNPEIHMVLIYCNSDCKDFYINLNEFAEGISEPSKLKLKVQEVCNNDKKIDVRKNMIKGMYSMDIKAGIDRFVKTVCELL